MSQFKGIHKALDPTQLEGAFAQDTNNAALYNGEVGLLSTRNGFKVAHTDKYPSNLLGIYPYNPFGDGLGNNRWMIPHAGGGVFIVDEHGASNHELTWMDTADEVDATNTATNPLTCSVVEPAVSAFVFSAFAASETFDLSTSTHNLFSELMKHYWKSTTTNTILFRVSLGLRVGGVDVEILSYSMSVKPGGNAEGSMEWADFKGGFVGFHPAKGTASGMWTQIVIEDDWPAGSTAGDFVKLDIGGGR